MNRPAFVSYTRSDGGGWTAWLTETQPPRAASARDMLLYPGEVWFGTGATAEEALAAAESDVPARRTA